MSRLSRLNSDWHKVIELCAVFRTLIADKDRVYDAQSPNDRLLLGEPPRVSRRRFGVCYAATGMSSSAA